MSSPAQIAANRANAAHSTGPTSDGGKARSRFNSLKHGLYARDVVLPGEDRDAYDALVAELMAEFEPHGRYETMLVERLADISWRLGRSAGIEAGLLSPDWENSLWPGHATGGGPLVDTFRVAIDETPTLDRLGRYEGRLARAFETTAELLERRQKWRLKCADRKANPEAIRDVMRDGGE